MAAVTDIANGLRGLADWLDENAGVVPEYGIGDTHDFNVVCSTLDQLVAAARTGGRWEKLDQGSYFTVRRSFGPVNLDFFIAREKVCRRVVVDTIEHPERVVPASVVPASVEEVVEWVCDEPLLAGAGALA